MQKCDKCNSVVNLLESKSIAEQWICSQHSGNTVLETHDPCYTVVAIVAAARSMQPYGVRVLETNALNNT